MADLFVQPGYQFREEDIITVDKLNLMATPLVSLSIETPVTDINFFRNGNFYSSFWATPGGVTCPVGTETQNASYWTVNPNGAAVWCKRSTDVPDAYSLWSLEIDGAPSVTDCSIGQAINGDLSATLRRPSTFSGYIENNSGSVLSSTLEVWTADTFNNFSTVTKQTTVNLQTVPNAAWAYVTATIDLSTVTNVGNGLLLKVRLPNGTLTTSAKRVNFSRLKFQLGEVATQFADDPSQFIQTPSIDSTMLQDGCLARPGLYVTNPGVIPKGAYGPGSIQSADIGVGQVKAINLDPGISTTTAANFTVPAANANVAITMTSATGISTGLVLSIAGAGSYSTVSVASNVVTAQNTGAAGNAAPGTIINSGASVTTSGNAVIGGLGYTPINKAGDSAIGPGALGFNNDDPVGSTTIGKAAILVNISAANQNNDGFMPAISFNRPSVFGRAIGLSTTGRFKTVDHTSKVGYLLDTVTGVDTASYQAGSITLQALAQSLINIVIPAGMVRMFAGPAIPTGWLVCDGNHYLQSQYPALYSALGAYWGAGGSGASAWFAVPDFRGRSPLGYVNSAVTGITARAFGSNGGEENHQLSIAELTNHDHTLSDPQHSHGITQSAHAHSYIDPTGGRFGVFGGGTQIFYPGGATNTSSQNANITINNSPTNVTMAKTGGNATHNNMQPYAVLYFVIKT